MPLGKVGWVLGLGLVACSNDSTGTTGDTFSVHASVTAHLNASDAAFCDVSWLTQVNDNGRSYTYSVTFTTSGVGSSTYGGTTTGTEAVSTTLSGTAGGVSWHFTWDTLQGSGSVQISACGVH